MPIPDGQRVRIKPDEPFNAGMTGYVVTATTLAPFVVVCLDGLTDSSPSAVEPFPKGSRLFREQDFDRIEE